VREAGSLSCARTLEPYLRRAGARTDAWCQVRLSSWTILAATRSRACAIEADGASLVYLAPYSSISIRASRPRNGPTYFANAGYVLSEAIRSRATLRAFSCPFETDVLRDTRLEPKQITVSSVAGSNFTVFNQLAGAVSIILNYSGVMPALVSRRQDKPSRPRETAPHDEESSPFFYDGKDMTLLIPTGRSIMRSTAWSIGVRSSIRALTASGQRKWKSCRSAMAAAKACGPALTVPRTT
jgi:hypothetical protein